MNKEEQIMLRIIGASQFGLSSPISLDGVDLDALYREASIQSVLGLVATEIAENCYSENFQIAQYSQVAKYIQYCYAEEKLKKVLDDRMIPFVILKGNSAAISYKEPCRRAMGDIDFIVPPDQYEQAKIALCDSGFVPEHDDGRHIEYTMDGFIFELHHHYSHGIDIEKYLINGLKFQVMVSIDEHVFPMLPPLANGIVLLDHIRRHLRSALGLRQVIDWMMYVYRNLDDDIWNEKFSIIAKENGMDILAITVTRMCQIYLGLPETISWCRVADEKTCELLMECLLASGNFGRKNGHGKSVETVTTRIKGKGLLPWLQYAGEVNWKAYHKHHWLKPFCWFYQIFRYAKQGVKTGRNRKQIRGDLDRSKERFELLKKLGIE